MARKNATVTDAKANAEKVSTDATVAVEAPKKNDAKRKRTEETPQAPAANQGPATKKIKISMTDPSTHQILERNYANSIHISNLANPTTKEAVTKHFSDVGGIVHVLIFQKRPFFGKPGFVSGQVEFSSPQLAAKALKKDKTELEGTTIEVKAARPPPPPTPYHALRVFNLEPSVTKEDLASALSKWTDNIQEVKVPLQEGGSNLGYATIKLDGVEAASDIFTNFKTPIKGQVPVFHYQKVNIALQNHNAKVRAKAKTTREIKARKAAKELRIVQAKKQAEKLAAKKAFEKSRNIALAAKAQKVAQAAKATKLAQAEKVAKAAKHAKEIKAAANAKVAKIQAQAAAQSAKAAEKVKALKNAKA